jgi:hypothetical protein
VGATPRIDRPSRTTASPTIWRKIIGINPEASIHVVATQSELEAIMLCFALIADQRAPEGSCFWDRVVVATVW